MKYFQILILLWCTTVFAADTDAFIPSVGQYVRTGNSGTVTIRRGGAGELTFAIESMGGNCHTCSVSGDIRDGLGHAAGLSGSDDAACRIAFVPDGGGLRVSSTTAGACQGYCGMRADFSGLYRKPPALCTQKSRRARRDEFFRLYQTRDFARAVEVLEPLLAQCGEFVDWIEIDKIRNDLALAQYHGGTPEACRETLAETRAARFANDEELRQAFPPCDYDNYVGTAKATWHNITLCDTPRGKH
ncbi:MAG: hypothetical protein BWK76_03955 [Desulfobulbaceae bacterium A2]|nr:MAG: hypothetical protein BWK76_03955 [Desulfobulbaceae bacterium A2]